MTAHIHHDDKLHFAKPPTPPPMSLQPVPLAIVNDLVRCAMRLQQSGPMEFCETPFLTLVSGLIKLQKIMQQPALVTEPVQADAPPAKKARCTEWEARAYCKQLGLPEDDGSWFVDKMEGIGWKINKTGVKDAMRVIRSWWRAGHFPSQKAALRNLNSPANVAKDHVAQEIDKELARVRRGR